VIYNDYGLCARIDNRAKQKDCPGGVMSASADEKPVETFGLSPQQKKLQQVASRGASGFDPVKRAEEALDKLSANYPVWIREEAAKLSQQFNQAKANQFQPDDIAALFRVAIDLKSFGATFGYPLVSEVAHNICEIIEKMPHEKLPHAFLEKCTISIQAIIREDARQNHQTGRDLVSALNTMTDDYITALTKPNAPMKNKG
jgi:hypothetical protein